MVLQLLGAIFLTTCISSGAVQNNETATNFNNVEQHSKKKARDNEPLTESVVITTTNRQNYEILTEYDDDPGYAGYEYFEKAQLTTTSNNYTISGNIYIDTIGTVEDYADTAEISWNVANKQQFIHLTDYQKSKISRMFIVLQIQPYVYLNATTTQLDFRIDILNTYARPYYSYVMRTWKGTDTSLSQYINIQNTYTESFNYNLERRLNNDFSLIYEETIGEEYETLPADTFETLYVEIDNTQYVYRNNNYLFIEIIPTATPNTPNNYPMITVQPKGNGLPIYQQNKSRLFNTQEIDIITNYYIPTTGEGEIVDIPGLMFDILSMPFAFISQAFNLTIFPGTPYQVNISNLFLCIIGVIVFITIINFIVKR